jgi:hypothetical protein
MIQVSLLLSLSVDICSAQDKIVSVSHVPVHHHAELSGYSIKQFMQSNDKPKDTSRKYWKWIKKSGTPQNGRVFVATSVVGKYPILGLFVSKFQQKGSLITTYDEVYKQKDCFEGSECEEKSHVIRVPGTDFVLDGKPWAKMSHRDPKQMQEDFKKPVPKRMHILPYLPHAHNQVFKGF